MVGARWVYGGLLIIQQLVVRCQRSFSSFDGRPYIQITFLSLDGANHDALDEELLGEGDKRHDRQSRDHNGSGLQGSRREAAMVVLRYEGAPGIDWTALVGKGLMFDAGGYHLKSIDGMNGMKSVSYTHLRAHET